MTGHSGKELIRLCGQGDKADVQKSLDDMTSNWEALNASYCNREESLKDATNLSKAYEDGKKKVDDYLTDAEGQLEAMQAVGTEAQTVKRQLDDLKVREMLMAVENGRILGRDFNDQNKYLLVI